MIRCVKCSKEAEYTVNGQSVCKEHKEDNEKIGIGDNMGDKLIGNILR